MYRNEELYQMCVRHFNEPMISSFEVCRLIGYAETGVDCYIIVRFPNSCSRKINERYLTCVGGYTFLPRLRGQGYVLSNSGEEWDDFYRLDNMLALNGSPKENEFRLEIDHSDEEGMDISPEEQRLNDELWARNEIALAYQRISELKKMF